MTLLKSFLLTLLLASFINNAPCERQEALKYISKFYRYYPKIQSFRVEEHLDIIIGCKLDGPRTFVLLYESSDTVRVGLRSSARSLVSCIEDQNVAIPQMNIRWCIDTLFDLKDFTEFFKDRNLTFNSADFSIVDNLEESEDSLVNDVFKNCEGIVTDKDTQERMKVKLGFSISSASLSCSISYENVAVEPESSRFVTESE